MNKRKLTNWLIVLSLPLLVLCMGKLVYAITEPTHGLLEEPSAQNASKLAGPSASLALIGTQHDDVATDTAGVALSPNHNRSTTPGTVITYTHILTNTGNGSDTFTLDAVSSQGWPVTLSNEAFPAGAVPQGTTTLPLSPSLTTTLWVRLSVPDRLMSGTLNIITGTVDVTIVTATSQIDPAIFATVANTTTVRAGLHTVFLPSAFKQRDPLIKLGVDFWAHITDTERLEYDIPLVKDLGASWVRIYLPWLYIETSPGEYNWEPFDAVFERLNEIGLEPLPIVYGPPEWAAEENCGPISDTLAFEGFLETILGRYGHYARAWEFTNEPDGMYPHPWGPTAGCWGLHPEEYANQLGIFYTKVKTLDPGALVVYGGLAYDRWEQFERSFFEKTLQYGAGQFFDVANIHYYPINLREFPTMAHKINEIRAIMTRNGVHGKRIWVTETGMWVNDIGVEKFKGSVELQREFIVKELTRGFGAGADNIYWFDVREHYTEEGWVHRWFISEDHELINGYDTFQHYADKLKDMSYPIPYQDVPADVEAYRFTASSHSLYILWSNTITQTVEIPATTHATLTDRDGRTSRTIPVQNGHVSFEVGTKPVFLEILQPGFEHSRFIFCSSQWKFCVE